jgi:hypothetical protein
VTLSSIVSVPPVFDAVTVYVFRSDTIFGRPLMMPVEVSNSSPEGSAGLKRKRGEEGKGEEGEGRVSAERSVGSTSSEGSYLDRVFHHP